MDGLARAVSAIDSINRLVVWVVAWFTLATVMVCGAVVLLRYSAGQGHVWMQELYVWTHAMTFLLAAGFAYPLNAHVRVDTVRLQMKGSVMRPEITRVTEHFCRGTGERLLRRC